MRPDSTAFRRQLKQSQTERYPLVFVAPGSGQVASYAVRGGAHFLMILNAGLYRSAGVSSLCSFMPFGNANQQTLSLLSEQILPRSNTIPLVAGVMAADPTLDIDRHLDQLAERGVIGVTNWPAVGLIDGSFRQILEEQGLTVQAEAEMLRKAKERGFVTFGFTLAPEDAATMATTGADAMVLNIGWTREIKDIRERSDRIEHTAIHINNMINAIRETGANPTCFFFGGTILHPEDSAQLYQRTDVHGFGGGSSIERIPVADLIINNVRKFRAVPKDQTSDLSARGLGKFIGNSPAMDAIYRTIKRVAPFDVSVCISGESGVGKELIANQIHQLSRRASGPFITLNCGAIPDTLIESELFGHEKGSFTGAVARHLGKFELANGGSLFLDEVAELSPKAQVSLLRVLQQGEITRVGSEKAHPVDVRIITATHQNLKALVKEGRFRGDLYFRLAVISLEVPPLRQRHEDIPALVDFFLTRHGDQFGRKMIGLTSEYMARLMQHDWPGNVRELEHLLCRSILLEDGPILEGVDFIPEGQDETPAATARGLSNLDHTEKTLLQRALKETAGNKTMAARLLGISRKTLYSRLHKHAIQ